MIMLLAACSGPDLSDLDVDLLDEVIDNWLQTDDAGLPKVEPLACLFLGSDGEAIVGDTDESYLPDWYIIDSHTVGLRYTGLGKLGTLEFNRDRHDVSTWLVTFDGSGYHGIVNARPGCALVEE